MTKQLFHRITTTIASNYYYFRQNPDARGLLGCTPRQKVTAALRMLANSNSADELDEKLRMGKTTIAEATQKFAWAIIRLFGDEYLRRPNAQDVARLLEIGERRGFPGMLGSLDCMHWQWDKCPTGWHGFYSGHCQHPTVILEAVASSDLWIWHANFGIPRSCNDINVLHRSHLFDDLAQGNAPLVNFTVNGNSYDMGYYLADGIYPEWATLVKGVHCPITDEQKFFTLKQAECRKDVERVFGVLQAR
jgi:hypothetical protein